MLGEDKERAEGKGKGKAKAKAAPRGFTSYTPQDFEKLLSRQGQSKASHGLGDAAGRHMGSVQLLGELREIVMASDGHALDKALVRRLQGIVTEAKLFQALDTDVPVAAEVEDTDFSPRLQGGELIHATKYEHWPAIQASGLRGESTIDFVAPSAKSTRGCVAGVMAADLLIYVDVAKATQADLQFTRDPSHHETILCHTTTLPVGFFSKVVDIRSGELLWDASHGGSLKDAEFTTDRLRQMKLYATSRIRATLHKAVDVAYTHPKSLKCSDFGVMDQLHYLGYEAIDDFFGRYAPALRNSAAPIIDIGTGFGGTARYMWEQYGARVTGIEYQPEMARMFTVLNRLLSIPETELDIEQGDFAHMDLAYLGLQGRFQAFTSQLVFLHIADKSSLFEKCGLALQDGGYFMIEDYFVQDGEELSEEDKRILAEDVSVPNGTPSTESEYRALLAANGLIVEEWTDLTVRWCTFIWERCEAFLKARPALEKEHGAEYVQEQTDFYAAVTKVYHRIEDGNRLERFPLVSAQISWQEAWESKPQALRGVRIVGRKAAAPL